MVHRGGSPAHSPLSPPGGAPARLLPRPFQLRGGFQADLVREILLRPLLAASTEAGDWIAHAGEPHGEVEFSTHWIKSC